MTGHSNLCDLGAGIILGPQLDGTYRFHARGPRIGQMCLLGTFSPYTVVPAASVVKIDDDIPLDKAALVGCGVTTGCGSAVYTAEVRPGDTVVVMGVGGIGINAVQGARIAGAENIVAIDPVRLQAGAGRGVRRHPQRRRVDEALADIVSEHHPGPAWPRRPSSPPTSPRAPTSARPCRWSASGGRVVVTAIGHPTETKVEMSLFELTLYEKQIRRLAVRLGQPPGRHPPPPVALPDR